MSQGIHTDFNEGFFGLKCNTHRMFSSSINYNGFSYFTSCFSALQTQGFKVKISTERLHFIEYSYRNQV